MPFGSVKYTPTGVVSALSPEEEEIRREIRSLKGLVLNRFVIGCYTQKTIVLNCNQQEIIHATSYSNSEPSRFMKIKLAEVVSEV
jgi:hypothetical protein